MRSDHLQSQRTRKRRARCAPAHMLDVWVRQGVIIL